MLAESHEPKNRPNAEPRGMPSEYMLKARARRLGPTLSAINA